MSERDDLIVRLRAALEREPLINLHHNHIELAFEADRLILSGEVANIGAKRAAARIAANFFSHWEDRLRVLPAETREDGAIKDVLELAFRTEGGFHNCSIAISWNEQHERVTDLRDEPPCLIDIFIQDGVVTLKGAVISLSHRRLAEALAWWSPGVTDVRSELEVLPGEADNDDEITDAVNMVLDKDPLVHNGQIRVGTEQGVVTLDGLVREETERQMAENDAWYLSGVRQVVNRIEVRHGTPGAG